VSGRFTPEQYDEAVLAIQSRSAGRPRIGIILGSGLSALADDVEDGVSIPYEEIPHFPLPTVEGHAGRLVIGHLEDHPVVLMQGRIHHYEGFSMPQVTFPVRVMQRLGIDTLIVTNAAGGINQSFHVGDLMLITDHIGFLNLTGKNPLHGPNDESFGPRFPGMTQTYDRALRSLALTEAERHGIPLHQGVYVGLSGPSFETPAELRFLQAVGGDAVGMSTVPEVTVARHAGVRVLGISGITNVAILDPDEDREANHEEVLEAGKVIGPRLMTLARGVLRRLED
jgi:purine-nucleoside phosphorylase